MRLLRGHRPEDLLDPGHGEGGQAGRDPAVQHQPELRARALDGPHTRLGTSILLSTFKCFMVLKSILQEQFECSDLVEPGDDICRPGQPGVHPHYHQVALHSPHGEPAQAAVHGGF